MSSPQSPRSRKSSSPNRSAPSSPQRTPRSAARRRPLHERSDSEKNSIYRQNPFPTLPSQVFSPKSDFYSFEDGPSSANQHPTIPAKSPKRLLSSSASLRSITSNLDIANNENASSSSPNVPPLHPSGLSNTNTSATFESTDQPRSKLRRRTSTSAGKSFKSASTEGTSTALDVAGTRESQNDDLPVSEYATAPSPESFASRTIGRNRSSTDLPPMLRHKSVERLRPYPSNGSKSSRTRGQPTPQETPKQTEDRPRSSSSPNTPTDAFIQALIKKGTNVQYPQLRQPSATSLRSESSSTRAAYPPPLRLHRKRANSQLAKTAGIVKRGGSNSTSGSSEANWQYPTLRRVQSQTSFSTDVSDGMIPEAPESPRNRVSGYWGEEIDDTVAELNTQRIKRQRSDHQLPYQGPDHPSRESLRSSGGSFYQFLNDSRTAWARFYYKGDDRLRLETPPNVEHLSYGTDYSGVIYPGLEYDTRVERSLHERQSSATPSGQSSSLGPNYSPAPSHSPGSAGFPDRIYIPRIRPFPRDNSNTNNNYCVPVAAPAASTTDDDDDLSITVIPPRPREPSQPSQVSYNHLSLASPVFNPTPAVPHLSPSKRQGPGLPYWRVPSFDETSGPFGRSNIQLLLFCTGFLFPPAWWLAAFLPLPNLPQWWDSESFEQQCKELSNSIYESAEIERYRAAQWWRNLNRFMAIAGILIVATVIACIVVATT